MNHRNNNNVNTKNNVQSVGVEVLGELQGNRRHRGGRAPPEEEVRPDGDVAQQLGQRRQQHAVGVGVERVRKHVPVALQVCPQVGTQLAGMKVVLNRVLQEELYKFRNKMKKENYVLCRSHC